MPVTYLTDRKIINKRNPGTFIIVSGLIIYSKQAVVV